MRRIKGPAVFLAQFLRDEEPFCSLAGIGKWFAGLVGLEGLSFNPMMLLHGEQEIELSGPIPSQAKVDNTAKVSGVYDKGKGALVVVEAQTNDESGRPLFVNRFAAFLRGEGGFGGEPGPAPGNEPPARDPDHVVESPTLPQQALLYRLSGDKNPLHIDPSFAQLGGFDRPILHGLCSYGIVCKAVVDTALGGDVGAVAGYRARFSGFTEKDARTACDRLTKQGMFEIWISVWR